MKLNISLAQGGKNCCGPVSHDIPKEWYPSLHFEHSEDIELPKQGTMTVRFRKIESTEREQGDKEIYACTVEVQEIISVNASAEESPAKSYGKDTEDALDSIKAEMEEED